MEDFDIPDPVRWTKIAILVFTMTVGLLILCLKL